MQPHAIRSTNRPVTRPIVLALAASSLLHATAMVVYLNSYQLDSLSARFSWANGERAVRPEPEDQASVVRVTLDNAQFDAPPDVSSATAATTFAVTKTAAATAAAIDDSEHFAQQPLPPTPPSARPPANPPEMPIEAPVPATGPVLPEPIRQVAVRYDAEALEALAAVELNPVPHLIEPFALDLPSTALLTSTTVSETVANSAVSFDTGRTPLADAEREALHAALRYVEKRLVKATDANEWMRYRNGSQQYELHLEREPAASAMELEHAVLEVHTVKNGVPVQARIPAKRVAFSHYAQVVDRWNPDVSLASDQIIGRFHANSAVHVAADSTQQPLVTGASTVAGRLVFAGGARRSKVFPSGVETGVPRMPLPRHALDWEALDVGEEQVHRLHKDAQIVFKVDGSYSWRTLESDITYTVMPTGTPWLLIADEGVELRVEGTVAGNLVVYSPTRVSISGDLRYAHDPHQERSEDYIGLISDDYVEIAHPDITGPGDLSVQAVVFAGRQFRVRRYRDSHGGTLSIFGSVTAGSLSATEPRYSTLLEFDARLEEQRPAFFPMTNHYVFDDVETVWTPAPGSTAALR